MPRRWSLSSTCIACWGRAVCPKQLSSRIILVPWPTADAAHGWLGLLTAHVSEIRDLPLPTSGAQATADASGWSQTFVENNEIVRLVDLDRLLSPAIASNWPEYSPHEPGNSYRTAAPTCRAGCQFARSQCAADGRGGPTTSTGHR